MTLDSVFEIPVHAVARRVGEDVVILDLSGGRYMSLNPVGARIWELIGEGLSLAEISAALLDEYDVSRETLENDVLRLAGELAGAGLVEELTPDSGGSRP